MDLRIQFVVLTCINVLLFELSWHYNFELGHLSDDEKVFHQKNTKHKINQADSSNHLQENNLPNNQNLFTFSLTLRKQKHKVLHLSTQSPWLIM